MTDNYGETIAKALATEDGHLLIGRGGFSLHFGSGWLSGYDCEPVKAAAIAARLRRARKRIFNAAPCASPWPLGLDARSCARRRRFRSKIRIGVTPSISIGYGRSAVFGVADDNCSPVFAPSRRRRDICCGRSPACSASQFRTGFAPPAGQTGAASHVCAARA